MADCPSVCLMMDDRWGAIKNPCEGEQGHEGDHFHDLGATMPRARLVWSEADGE